MADSHKSKRGLEPPNGFGKVLNRHGYGLQYSILKVAETLYERHRSAWRFEVAEFPVMVNDVGTRIDFILRHRERSQLLVVECKRANPALANWCFVKAPYVRGARVTEELFAEHLYIAGNLTMQSGVKALGYLADTYHLGLEMKTGAEGGKDDSGRGAIEEAATQVCRGLNGLVEYYGTQQTVAHKQLPTNWELAISPVIFTTANLWVSDVDLSAATPATGEIDPETAQLLPRHYVTYQYHMSPGIKHRVRSGWELRPLGKALDIDYVRTIHIVNADFAEEFLKFASNIWNE